jgi:hypothetical protein
MGTPSLGILADARFDSLDQNPLNAICMCKMCRALVKPSPDAIKNIYRRRR